jgi:hypothetical protein
MYLLYELKTFRSEDALHQHTVGGGPLVQLGADNDVVGAMPDDLLVLHLIFWDALLHDAGDEVKVPVVFSLRHEDVTAPGGGVSLCNVSRSLRSLIDGLRRSRMNTPAGTSARLDPSLVSQLGEDIGRHIVVAGDVVELQALEVSLELAHLNIVGVHRVLLMSQALLTWSMTTLESPYVMSRLILRETTMHSPWIRASYSAPLLDAL